VKLCPVLGWADFSLEVQSVKSEPYRDTRGPAVMASAVSSITRLAHGTPAPPRVGYKGRRLVRLFYDVGCGAARPLPSTWNDLNVEAGTVSIPGEGKNGERGAHMPEPTTSLPRRHCR